MILVIDNYDSFTYNLVQYIGELAGDKEIQVYRNDKITAADIYKLKPERIVLSPGPGNPDGAGNCLAIVHQLKGLISLLGVCLGHQIIGQVYGGKVVAAKKLMHGKTSSIEHNGQSIFEGLANNFQAGRYHSLALCAETIPEMITVTATADDGEIMAIEHKEYPLWGIQFHPESILTGSGKKIINNFLKGGQ